MSHAVNCPAVFDTGLGRSCDCQPQPEPTSGMCTACGSVEVNLVRVTGSRDLSHIGESSCYPTGYGCEVCS